MEGNIINYNEFKFEILNEKPKIVIALKSKKNFSKVNETNKREIHLPAFFRFQSMD